MNDVLSREERRKLIRNLTLSISTIVSCGHAMRVAVADMLQDFENLRDVTEGDVEASLLCEQLQRAVEDDIVQNRHVFRILGLEIH
ncbi:hypothetical protein LAC81_08095 [Ensifer adhaerens]|uniref:hypothetical protein n=1 Tax=Ensifer adhaerens TaxID=106592 RepID=UPI001CBAE997|nr:hypothetical protein [Ensifer adhaerens]MBZ7921738.1 hypothetical protein [Ensifer adhaerens]UAX94145.1 hypothetical protein LAC78_08090 [Ensifer adhaerens]UAY01779.1 hypothetical protein LAC80_08095 [Ensifer adhaerens]UAY09163.1 hypothetical protein LAC81_08095 [Ensifer adhaerens]